MFLPSFNHTPENNMNCRVEEVANPRTRKGKKIY